MASAPIDRVDKDNSLRRSIDLRLQFSSSIEISLSSRCVTSLMSENVLASEREALKDVSDGCRLADRDERMRRSSVSGMENQSPSSIGEPSLSLSTNIDICISWSEGLM